MISIGRVTCLGQNYADDVESRSIEIFKKDATGLPYEIGHRVKVTLVIDGVPFKAGLRATERNHTVWISPDLLDGSGAKIRLADVVPNYRCNQWIEIEAKGKVLQVLTPPSKSARLTMPASPQSRTSSTASARRKAPRRTSLELGRPPSFRPSRPGPYLLDPKIAERAIREYNTDPKVRSQEEVAFRDLGHGLRQGAVERQLQALNTAYSTRSSLDDLTVIASALEAEWDCWKTLLSTIQPLDVAVPEVRRIRALLAFFLDQDTRRAPRSLATKVMHFARPKTFIPTDTYAADKIGSELGSGPIKCFERLG